jgi:hypothetical protein
MLSLFFTQRVIMGVVRHGLTTIGGAMVANGYLDAAAAETVTGAGIALAGVAWSIWEKRF